MRFSEPLLATNSIGISAVLEAQPMLRSGDPTVQRGESLEFEPTTVNCLYPLFQRKGLEGLKIVKDTRYISKLSIFHNPINSESLTISAATTHHTSIVARSPHSLHASEAPQSDLIPRCKRNQLVEQEVFLMVFDGDSWWLMVVILDDVCSIFF